MAFVNIFLQINTKVITIFMTIYTYFYFHKGLYTNANFCSLNINTIHIYWWRNILPDYLLILPISNKRICSTSKQSDGHRIARFMKLMLMITRWWRWCARIFLCMFDPLMLTDIGPWTLTTTPSLTVQSFSIAFIWLTVINEVFPQ